MFGLLPWFVKTVTSTLRPIQDRAAINRSVMASGIAVSELRPLERSLEDVFFQLTGGQAGIMIATIRAEWRKNRFRPAFLVSLGVVAASTVFVYASCGTSRPTRVPGTSRASRS